MENTTRVKEFAKYVSLNVMGMFGVSCYILADTFFVSKGLGADGLTALNLAIPVYSIIHGCGLMIGMGGGIRFSIQKGQNDTYGSNLIFTNAAYLAAVFAAVFLLTGYFFAGKIVGWFGARGHVYLLSKEYVQVILAFSPAFLLNNLLLCFVRNDQAPQLSMAAMITGSLSNVILDWIFIFPCGWGIFGAAFATGLAPLISMLVLSVHFLRKNNTFYLVKCSPDRKQTGWIVSGGLPSLVTEVSSGIVMIVFNTMIMKARGNVGVAAYGIVANLSLVVVSIYTGIAQGSQPLQSQSFGAGKQENVRAYLRYAMTVMLIFSLCTYLAIVFGAGFITTIFNSEHNIQLQKIAVDGLRLYFIACPFAGFNILLSSYLTSTGQPLPAHLISLLRGFFVIIPMVFLLSAIADIYGIWCAFPAAESLVAIVGAGLFLKNSYKMRENI